jgi:hypothetical protein
MLICLGSLTRVWELESIGFVEPEGTLLQILFDGWKGGTLQQPVIGLSLHSGKRGRNMGAVCSGNGGEPWALTDGEERGQRVE